MGLECIFENNDLFEVERVKDLLKKNNIEDLDDTEKSDAEIANILLGDVISDSLMELMNKMEEWANIREEDPTL